MEISPQLFDQSRQQINKKQSNQAKT